MKVFADTVWFEALLNRRDQYHHQAVAMSRGVTAHIVTTEFILLELGAAFSDPQDRADFMLVDEMVRTRPDVTLISASSELLQRGKELFAARPDKGWSLTDCISFVVMKEHDTTDALTADQHFVQAGFRALLIQDA